LPELKRSSVSSLLVAIVVVGVALRSAQYLADTSLWLDEIALVKGILERDLRQLVTESLPYDQLAPIGFLIAQKTAVNALGSSDTVLRLIPFLGSLVALVVFALFVNRTLSSVAALVATILFATAAPLIAFAGTVKQYSTDVCVAVVLSWIALGLVTQPVSARQAWLAAAAGALLQWFSHASVLVAAGLVVPVWLFMSAAPPDARRRRVGIVVGMWAASALAVTTWSLVTTNPETQNYMRLYWADGLAPATLGDWMRTGWPWPSIHRLFRGGFGAQAGLAYPLAPLYVVLAAAGFVFLWRRDRRVALILLAPLAVTLAAAAARLYPFRDRLILFLVPAAFAAIGEVSVVAARAAMPISRALAASTVAAITIAGVVPVATTLPPYRVEDVKHVLRYVQAKRQPGDQVYVYYGAAAVMSVYDTTFGFSPATYAVGGCHRGDSRRYFEELDTFRGTARVWIVLTHSLPAYREREDIVAYLDAIGTREDYVNVPSRAVSGQPLPAEGFAYNLSAPARLASSDSASFAVTGPSGTSQGNTCADGPHAMIPSDFVCAGTSGSRCVRRAPGAPPVTARFAAIAASSPSR
jgi:hypothetical protein